MTIRIGINGLGRIGRSVLRAIFEVEKYSKQIEVVAVNGSLDASLHAHLIKYDSIHGKFNGDVDFSDSESWLSINHKKFPLYRERNPENIPWDVDVVLECTGAFNKHAAAAKHNSEKVIVSAPVADSDVTIVYGVNNHMLKKEHRVISAGSCTTNCLAPVAQILHSSVGIKSGFMTTIHAYTNDQNILDGNHKDLRRARACALSMIPTTTGAAKTIGSVIPELKGKLDGTAVRVPVANVSMVDFKFITDKKVTAKEINEIFENATHEMINRPLSKPIYGKKFLGEVQASTTEYLDVFEECRSTSTTKLPSEIEFQKRSNVLSVCKEPMVSIDFVHNPYSAIVDLSGTYVTGDICRVAAWYDNEWAFALRMLDIALII
ncbi:MAG TPA: type I glyceraldehyde-3-phosphate dehydrogenase [Wolbachia sp.]|uniref:type I glyceraldehyde-3-phosphate dehydrogenase n=1 Tax=Wolbachia endosymbiont of Pentalonia nigronervosa TaxID=1301914 RepID=UPI000EE3A80E|nr:glyceraldehyde 3-phosphate dehydrogenase NAD-binding domain-containing protein [Wolbachia endosymbiont of Pentalonia nigronervosa]MBD0391707.1 type I glyceraldehyde-3-phosphate dehydrogenase [Wolbachia endosymbiont of Pentalonia nigronervosa]HCE59594.1 type I glyceraldehyde-3-phosphate dehydrogenase [Wolbachia sp.]